MHAPTQEDRSITPVDELLEIARHASGGRLLALQGDLARSPAVLAASVGLRRAGVDHATLGITTRAAIMLAVGAVDDPRLAALLAVVREAATNTGRVEPTTWATATKAGWSAEQLIEALAFLALTMFVDHFAHDGGTRLDIPAAAPVTIDRSAR
jgi:hypothetical protein